MRIGFIVCAAGKGERADFGKNKLLAPFLGANALYYTVQRILSLFPLLRERGDEPAETIVTVSAEDEREIAAMLAPYGCKTVRGGATRTQSVYNALREATGDLVLIHDGARPFTTADQFLCCIDCVKRHRSAVVAMPATDTTVVSRDGWIGDIPERNTVYRVQTPQGFFTRDIRSAYEQAVKDAGVFTDDGSVYTRYVSPARICPCGTETNRKLTFREDFARYALPFSPVVSKNARVGFGVDVHAFGRDCRYVTLCGVKVANDTGLIAHSDGDVALHAVMDALLSAAGLKDIGHYFPDGDPAYKDADSAKLLEKVMTLVRGKGLKVSALTVSVQAERPRLAEYIDGMIDRLRQLTDAPDGAVSITAGTCEGLGYVGEGRGICAYCAAILEEERER